MSARRSPTRRTARVGQLLERVIQQRRSANAAAASQADDAGHERITALEQRVEHLEALLESLQDSIHREAARHEKEMKALGAKAQAPEMARALDRYSREHGV